MVTLASFRYAWRGLKEVFSTERNAKIHLLAALSALLASLIFHIAITQLVFVIIAITLVFFAEIVNTALEKTLDVLSKESNQVVRMIKDMTAAGVLVTAAGAVLVAILVFGPYLYRLFCR